MDLQHISAFAARPLASLADDYGAAVLHLAWCRGALDGQRSLLFACVELLPHEVPAPLDDGPQRHRFGERGTHEVFVRHAVGSAEAALRWYLRVRRGETAALVHGEDEERDAEIAGDDDSASLDAPLLGEEPVWPNLVCVTENVPFLPAGSDGDRAHHLVPLVEVWPSGTPRTRPRCSGPRNDLILPRSG